MRNIINYKKLQKDGYKYYKYGKLTIIAHNSIKNFFPLLYMNHVPKPMLSTKILILIDRIPDNFKD